MLNHKLPPPFRSRPLPVTVGAVIAAIAAAIVLSYLISVWLGWTTQPLSFIF